MIAIKDAILPESGKRKFMKMKGIIMIGTKYFHLSISLIIFTIFYSNPSFSETNWEYRYFSEPNNNYTTVKILKDGNSACASYNGSDCLWGVKFDSIIFSSLSPLVCTKDSYYRGHWCYETGKNIPGSIAFAAAKSEREETDRKRKEKEEEDRIFKSILEGSDPQKMYLAAGSSIRNGDLYKAKQIFEAIIRRFPDSQFAVKANDQLLATDRATENRSAAERINSDAKFRNYQSCKEEMAACYSRTSGKGQCYRNCDSLL